ncbi:hypothetical protein B5F13_00440 [Drancourtella sp. An177]|nr:hypothetical protein B5F13_00440 [Drancourtella sp. An177]
MEELFKQPLGVQLVNLYAMRLKCLREGNGMHQAIYLFRYLKILAMLGIIPYSVYKECDLKYGWREESAKLYFCIARVLWNELGVYKKDADIPDIKALSDQLNRYPAIRYNWLERAYLQRDSDIIRMELHGNYYIFLVHRPDKGENNLLIISKNMVNAIENTERNISDILMNTDEFKKIGGLTLAEGIRKFPCILEDFEEDILYYDLPDCDDYIGEYKMLTGNGKKGKMKTPNLFWSHTFWGSCSEKFAYWDKKKGIIYHEEGEERKLADLPNHCEVERKKNRIELCFTHESVLFERIFYDLEGNCLASSRSDRLEDMWWLIVQLVIPPGFRSMTDRDIDLLRRYHDNFSINWIREKLSERKSLTGKKEKAFQDILSLLEECGCDDDRDILSILVIMTHYTFRVVEDAFDVKRYFSELFYDVLVQAVDFHGKDQFLNKLESDPETVFAPYCIRTEEECMEMLDKAMFT